MPVDNSTFSIKVVNSSSVTKEFFLFTEKPTIDNGMEGIYQTYYLKESAAPDGTVEFTFKDEIYAVCGRAQVSPNGKVEQRNTAGPVSLKKPKVAQISCYETKVDTSTSTPPMSFEKTPGTPDFKPDQYPDGTFIIKTFGGFSQGDAFYIGIGKKNLKTSEIIPVAIKTPSPNSEHIVQPIRKFYVAWGSYNPGVLANFMATNKATEIDFTGGNNNASVTYKPDGLYSQVTYS